MLVETDRRRHRNTTQAVAVEPLVDVLRLKVPAVAVLQGVRRKR